MFGPDLEVITSLQKLEDEPKPTPPVKKEPKATVPEKKNAPKLVRPIPVRAGCGVKRPASELLVGMTESQMQVCVCDLAMSLTQLLHNSIPL